MQIEVRQEASLKKELGKELLTEAVSFVVVSCAFQVIVFLMGSQRSGYTFSPG